MTCVCTIIRVFVVICVIAGDDHLVGKMGLSESYNLYDHVEDYGMSG